MKVRHVPMLDYVCLVYYGVYLTNWRTRLTWHCVGLRKGRVDLNRCFLETSFSRQEIVWLHVSRTLESLRH